MAIGVINLLTIEANTYDELDKLKRFVNGRNGSFDFENIMPVPKGIKEKDDMYNVEKYSPRYLHNGEKYRGFAESDWRMDNWGVEENAQFIEISDDIEEKKKGTKSYYAMTYNFDTVNGTCYKVLKALSQKFKNLKFKWRYASESYGKDTGSYLFKGDKEVRKNYKEGSDKAVLHSMWCWGKL